MSGPIDKNIQSAHHDPAPKIAAGSREAVNMGRVFECREELSDVKDFLIDLLKQCPQGSSTITINSDRIKAVIAEVQDVQNEVEEFTSIQTDSAFSDTASPELSRTSEDMDSSGEIPSAPPSPPAMFSANRITSAAASTLPPPPPPPPPPSAFAPPPPPPPPGFAPPPPPPAGVVKKEKPALSEEEKQKGLAERVQARQQAKEQLDVVTKQLNALQKQHGPDLALRDSLPPKVKEWQEKQQSKVLDVQKTQSRLAFFTNWLEISLEAGAKLAIKKGGAVTELSRLDVAEQIVPALKELLTKETKALAGIEESLAKVQSQLASVCKKTDSVVTTITELTADKEVKRKTLANASGAIKEYCKEQKLKVPGESPTNQAEDQPSAAEGKKTGRGAFLDELKRFSKSKPELITPENVMNFIPDDE